MDKCCRFLKILFRRLRGFDGVKHTFRRVQLFTLNEEQGHDENNLWFTCISANNKKQSLAAYRWHVMEVYII